MQTQPQAQIQTQTTRQTQTKQTQTRCAEEYLEAPATPGLSDPSVQQGVVQRLEQSQKVAPRPKRSQPAATSSPNRRQGAQRGSGQFSMETPDPVQMAGDRIGGDQFSSTGGQAYVVDPTPWMPLLEKMASTPNAGGGLTSAFVEQLSAFRRQPIVTESFLIDLNEADEALGV